MKPQTTSSVSPGPMGPSRPGGSEHAPLPQVLESVTGPGVHVPGASPASVSRAGIRVDRAVGELRRGRPVKLSAGAEQILVVAVETMLPSSWAVLCSGTGELSVTLSAERAHASGWYEPSSVTQMPQSGTLSTPASPGQSVGVDARAPGLQLPISLSLPRDFEPRRLAELAGLDPHANEVGGIAAGPANGEWFGEGRGFDGGRRLNGSAAHHGGTAGSRNLNGHGRLEQPGDGGKAESSRHGSGRWASLLAVQSSAPAAQTTSAMRAALELARLARLVPAIVTLGLAQVGLSGPLAHAGQTGNDSDADPEYLGVSASDVLAYPQDRASSLLRVSEAPVPLAGHENSRFVLFRETVADLEHVAIIVGDPDPADPVMVRLHSSCLTGDLFSSLRCDCGDQLRGAISRLGDGGGVLLYLAQEGRGIGLANKLRAYARQDTGLDTIDADRYLGFRGDERNFSVAVQMLKALGIGRIRLLTNNPTKIAALRQAGLDVVERLPIGGHVNRHNKRYITTKRDRAGHLIDFATLPAGRNAG